MIFKDSLGYAHTIAEPLLKGGPAAFTADPPPWHGQFRALVDDMIALRESRRRLAERVKVQTNTRDRLAEKEAEQIARADHIRPTPASPAKTAPAPLRKSLESLARDAQRRTAQIQRGTEAIQRRTARALIDDLSAAAKAGKLDAISAAKLDALAHRHARDLGMETTGVRR